jgi:exonuclease SbcC
MELKKLRLRGFTGIKRGLGLEEISIDFANITGLAAFAGANGLGKSTVLENLHPYNALASREGALFNHVSRRDSEKELCFEYNGHDYKTLIKIDCQSGKSEGFIWKDGKSVVNGKISAYSKYITEVFGSSNLFFNSVFCAQNATKLSDMTTGQLKTLFAEFLRLDRLQGYEETSKQVINVLSGKVSQIDVNITALQKRLEGAENIKVDIDEVYAQKIDLENHRATLSEILKDAQAEREKLKEVIARNEVLQKQVEDMGKTFDDMNMSMFNEEGLIESQLSTLRTQYQSIVHEINELNTLLLDEAAIIKAAEKVSQLNALIEILTANTETANTAVTGIQEKIYGLETGLQELKNTLKQIGHDERLSAIDKEVHGLKQQITGYESQLKALEGRDHECTSKICTFILSAQKAETELLVAKDRIEQLQIDKENRINELTIIATATGNQIAEKETLLKNARNELAACQNMQSANRQELANARRDLTQYQNLAGKQAEIAVAKSKKEDRATALEENRKQGMAIAEAWKARKQALNDQIAAQQNKINEITSSINVKAADTLDVINHHIESTANQIVETDRHISETTAKIAKLQGELSGITEATEQLKKAQEEKSKVSADIADWTYLKNACGKNGLQAMEIDATAPLISSFANELLAKAFGPLFSVKLLTQDENGKECLDIIVIGDDGDEINLANLSGGQKVWCLMALRLAMTLLSKEKGGHSFLTAFSDESDGPLDSENAQNYVSMYRSFMDVGRFDSFLFISHRPECRHMADHVLNFEKGKNPYWN